MTEPDHSAEYERATAKLRAVTDSHSQCPDPWCEGPLDHLNARELFLVRSARNDGTRDKS